MHGDIPECGLCEYEAKNLEDIDIHPFLTKHTYIYANKTGVNNIKPSIENS